MRRLHHFLFITVILILAACQPEGTFKPGRETPTPVGTLFGRPLPVTFTELDSDPLAYRNQLIRVTGTYTPVQLPECDRLHGPVAHWALIGEGLRLDAIGHEVILGLVPEGTMLTVDGFWRMYEGPLGCGKEPPVGTAWYLETIRLVQPNPLPQFTPGASPRVTPSEGATSLPATPTPTATMTVTPTPSATTTGTPATATPTVSPSPTSAVTLTPSATPTPEEETATPTPTGTPVTETTPTPGPDGTPTAPAPTNTPGAYPGPQPATETPSSPYP